MTKEYTAWKEAKKDLNKKVRELLKDIHRQNIEYLKNAIERGNLVEDHLKTDQSFSVPKDFIIALAKKQEWNYRNHFGTRKGKSSSNRRVGKYLGDMGI
jgi:hypothetical protein